MVVTALVVAVDVVMAAKIVTVTATKIGVPHMRLLIQVTRLKNSSPLPHHLLLL